MKALLILPAALFLSLASLQDASAQRPPKRFYQHTNPVELGRPTGLPSKGKSSLQQVKLLSLQAPANRDARFEA
jgi:hypothetical protein